MNGRFALCAALALLAFCINIFALDLFGTVSLLFGSVVALVALTLLGLPLALVVAVAGASYTVFAWGHPYAILIFGAELLFVGLFARRSDNLALADALYWLCIGFPLVLLTYAVMMDLPLASAAFIGLKQAVNGILNAVVAGLILGFLPTLVPALRRKVANVSFDALLFHILAFVAMTTALALTVAESRTEYRRQTDQIEAFLEAIGTLSRQRLAQETGEEEDLRLVLQPLLGVSTGIEVAIDDIAIARVDPGSAHGDALGMTRSLGATGTARQVHDTLWRWSPDQSMPELLRANASVYFVHLAAADVSRDSDLRIELSALPVIMALEASGRRNLLLLAGAILFVLLASRLFVRHLTLPLTRLAAATEGLPRQIALNNATPELHPSSVREYDRLATAFQDMARELGNLFRERDDLTRTLEARVEERTRQLALLSQVARQTTDSVVVTDLDGRVTWANDAFETLTGYALDELLGKVPGQLLQREKPSADVLRDIRDGLRDRHGFHVTLLNHTKHGRPYWVEIRCNPLADDATEEPIGFIAIENDVTDRIAIQEALQQSHERLQLATEVAEMGIWSLDPKTGQMAWNDQNYHLHGVTPGQDVASKWLERVQPIEAKRLSTILDGLMDGSIADISFDFQLNHPDRGARILSSIARAVQDRGRIVSITGVTRDMTQDREASEQLRRAAKHTEAILNNVVDAIIAIDANGCITSVNRAAERIFGYGAPQMTGKTLALLIPPDEAAQQDGALRSALGGSPAQLTGRVSTFEAVRANGEIFPAELAVTEIDEGDGHFFVGILRDLTERERVERMQSEFLATVNHELRTPLTSIRGTLSLLQNRVVGDLDETGDRIVAAALQNAEQLGQMVEEMLDLERMRQDKLAIRLAPEPVQDLVVQSAELNRVLAGSRDIALSVEPFTGPARVLVDASRLTQILTNFIGNAVKFSNPGGTITIRTALCDGKVRVSIIDTGPGIPKDKQALLFQKFAQVDTSDARRHRGAGLGLAISRELATRMGGNVGLNSQEGSGSEFWVEFPCLPEETPPKSDMNVRTPEVDHA